MAASERTYTDKTQKFGATVKGLRRRANITVKELAGRSGLAASTISKIENGRLLPSYETMLRLADGLSVDVAELFNPTAVVSNIANISGRRSVTKRGRGTVHPSKHYRYEMLCSELSRKHFNPIVARVSARNISQFESLPHHEGEEFIYVLAGAIELHTEHYAPITLEEGDSCYFDSKMGHACVSVSKEDAQIIWITSRDIQPPVANAPAQKPLRKNRGRSLSNKKS